MDGASENPAASNGDKGASGASQTDLTSNSPTLKAYSKAKQEVARNLQFLREFVRVNGHQEQEDRCQQLLAKLAEDHFTLAVLGQFKRGKSTLMNAVLGRQVLPTGVLPLTSAITVLKFGPQEKLVIHREGALFPEEMPVSRLADYVTEKGNPGNEKKVILACLELPSAFLRRGLEFVDTPGVGSSIEANSAITYNFIPQCDAVVFVTSVDSPLSQVEKEFLTRIREHVRKIFFVVNKVDLLDDFERQEVLEFIRANLVRCVGADSVRLYPLSALMGLAAKRDAREERYAESGLQAFENALAQFLSEEKTEAFLISIVDRALHLLDEESQGMRLREKARAMSGKDRSVKIGELQASFASLREERTQCLAQSRERCVVFLNERLSKQLESFLGGIGPTLAEELNASLNKRPWTLSGRAAVRSAQACACRLREELDTWMARTVTELMPEVMEILRVEGTRMSHHLDRISSVASQVLEAEAIEETHSDSSSELPFAPALPNLSLPLISTRATVPAPLWCLPVILTRTRLAARLNLWLRNMLDASKDALREAVEFGVEIFMGQFSAEYAAQAEKIESGLLRVVSGRESTSGSSSGRALSSGDSRLKHEEMESLRDRLTRLRDGILGGAESGFRVEEAAELPASLEVVPQVRRETPSAEPRDEVAKDLETRGCPVCNKISKVASDFFVRWQYDLYGNEHVQQWYAANLGFCPLHTWQLEATSSPQGISRGYPPLAERLSRDLAGLSGNGARAAANAFSLVQRADSCRACQDLRECETAYIERLADLLNDPEARTLYEQSQGVCLRHLALLIEELESEETAQFLLKEASRHFEEFAEDMQSYSLKHDAVRRALHNEDEGDAYLRALIHIAGAKNLFFPWGAQDAG